MGAATTSRTGNEVDLVEEAATAPCGAAAKQLPACDLVMKGGITSGVVYPGAAIALAKSFRFAAVGGTSAGAIAAGVCAAAEYGRLRDSDGGLAELGSVSEDLSKEGFLTGLFQATPGARPLVDLGMLATRHPDDSPLRRAARIATSACARVPIVVVPALLVVPGLALLVWGAFRGFPGPLAAALTALVALPLVALVLALTGAAALALIVARAAKSLPGSNYGACPGSRQPGYGADQPALTEWLDERVQAAAGLPSLRWDQVLTVEDLRSNETPDRPRDHHHRPELRPPVALSGRTWLATASGRVRCATSFRPTWWPG